MTTRPTRMGADRAAWGNFLLRLAAVAWPFLMYGYFATASPSWPSHHPPAYCQALASDLELPVLTLVGLIALVDAANTVGRRKRHALVIAGTCGVAWIAIAVVVRWVVPANTCGNLF
jgi:hypothetical protein